MAFKVLKRDSIEQSLETNTRQYLVGRLGRPQSLVHIDDPDIEFGISRYQNANWEPALTHSRAKEFQYVLKGMTEYRDLETDEVHRFSTGDFYIIEPSTSYIQRIKQDTAILFAKLPAGNDKIDLEASEELLHWVKSPLRVKRLDLKGSTAPKANSLVPAAAAAVIDENNRILMLQRRDSGKWAMPGGTMELSESLEACIIREVKEETGIDIEVDSIIGTYTNPNNRIAYSDGEVRREFSILFYARADSKKIELDDESTDASWIQISDVKNLDMANSQSVRIKDVLDFLENKKVFIR